MTSFSADNALHGGWQQPEEPERIGIPDLHVGATTDKGQDWSEVPDLLHLWQLSETCAQQDHLEQEQPHRRQ